MKTIPGMKPLVNASGEEVQCIPEMVIESVNQTDADLHKELLSGVILTGAVKFISCTYIVCLPLWCLQVTCPTYIGFLLHELHV